VNPVNGNQFVEKKKNKTILFSHSHNSIWYGYLRPDTEINNNKPLNRLNRIFVILEIFYLEYLFELFLVLCFQVT